MSTILPIRKVTAKINGDGAACIRVQAADNVVLRNNEIDHCGNGLFAMMRLFYSRVLAELRRPI